MCGTRTHLSRRLTVPGLKRAARPPDYRFEALTLLLANELSRDPSKSTGEAPESSRSKPRTFMGSLTLHKSANYDSAEGICRKIYQFARDCPMTDTPRAC